MVSDEGAAAEFFQLVLAKSVVGRLPLRRVPFRTRMLLMLESPPVAWRDEGGSYRTSPIKLASLSGLERLDVGTMLVASRELLEDQSVDSELIIRDQLVKALSSAVDQAFLDPSNSGSAGVRPASVTNGASTDSPSENLFEWDSFQGDIQNSWIVMHPLQAARMSGAERPDIGANGGTWSGFRVITSTAHPDGSFTLIDPDYVALALGNPEVRASEEATVELVDSSSMASGSSVAAASMTSMFQVNAVSIIGSLNANWAVVRPEAVQTHDATAFGL
jgi:hypothetical protein